MNAALGPEVPTSPAMRVFVHLNYGEDVRNWPGRQERGEVRDPSAYGFAYAANEVDMAFSEDAVEGRLTSIVRRAIKGAVGFDILHAYRNRAGMATAEVVWTHTEKEHLAIAALKRFCLLRGNVPVIAHSIWIWGWLPQAGRVRRRITTWLLRTHALHAVGAPVGARIGSEFLGDEVVVMPFGTEPCLPAHPVVGTERPIVVAPGNDKDRDWALLGEVARARPDLDFLVLSRRRAARQLSKLPNVEVRSVSGGQGGMEAVYETCSAIVIPSMPNPHASGATTAMQAVTVNRPLVVTRTGDIDLYAGTYAHYCEVGDRDGLASAIDRAVASRNDDARLQAARDELFAHGLTEQTYAARHVLASRDLMAGRVVRKEVTELAPLA